jgi:histidyl-tRNA synthetase
MEIKLEGITYKGTRILFKETAALKRKLLNAMIDILYQYGYEEMMIPVIQLSSTFASKVGEENNNMMYNFTDRGNRNLCLAPEYTAVVQQMATGLYKYTKDVKIFYIGECFRGENPQAGRYRQFTQFGVEVLNPSKSYIGEMMTIATKLTELVTKNYSLNSDATRGLDYYKQGKGFEIACPDLGSSKQICGGGEYEGGIGFAMGVDRMLVLGIKENTNFWDGINKRWILVGDKYSFADKVYKVNKIGNTYHFLDKSGVADNFSSLTNIFDGIGVDVKYLGNE